MSRDEAKKDIVDCIEIFYSCRRRHSYLGYIGPREFEELLLLKKSGLANCLFLFDHVIACWSGTLGGSHRQSHLVCLRKTTVSYY